MSSKVAVKLINQCIPFSLCFTQKNIFTDVKCVKYFCVNYFHRVSSLIILQRLNRWL